MNSDNERVFHSEELYLEHLDINEQRKACAEERQALEKERDEIYRIKSSVEYLQQLFKKSQLEEALQLNVSENEASLKVHLYASKFESEQLRHQLDQVNSILSLSPYVYLLIDMNDMSINWASKNVKRILGFSAASLRHKNLRDLLLVPDQELVVKDGFILGQPILTADQSALHVDLHFQARVADDIEGTLITLHSVQERVDYFSNRIQAS